MSQDEYHSKVSCSINHFYEKLLLLKELMTTESGKKAAQHRHDFMLAFLDEFYQEIRSNNESGGN